MATYSTDNRDFKYVINSVSTLSIGPKYTYRELMEADECNFKLRTVIRLYMLREVDPETTLESHLYYLKKTDLSFDAYREMKCRLLVMIPSKDRRGGQVYREKKMKIEEFASIPPQEKEKSGLCIREIEISKLALMGMGV